MSDIIRDPPCPLCKREAEWTGPEDSDSDAEQHKCGEGNCPVSTFRFKQAERTYHDINVRSLTCNYDKRAWDNAGIDNALHEKDPNWENKILEAHQ